MKRIVNGFLCVVVCANLTGCGGTSELKPTTTAPTIDPKVLEAKREQSRKESMEKSGMQAPQANPSDSSGR